jgi:phage tail-like protein
VSERARAYRFKTAAQWQRAAAKGFDIAADGALRPIARLGSTARPLTTEGPVTLVTADPLGGPVWRLDTGTRRLLYRRTEFGRRAQGVGIDDVLGDATRWVLDRQWIWSFESDAAIVRRYERDTLQPDRSIDVGAQRILDLASDGHDGLWVLFEMADDGEWLLHLDCQGRQRERYPVSFDVKHARQLGVVARGKRLVLLTRDGRLALLEAAKGRVVRVVSSWSHGPCWRVDRLVTDGANRIALLCHDSSDADRWAVFIVDAGGDVIDSVTSPQDRLTLVPADVAIGGGVLWLAAGDGLWQVDASEASVARESESVLLTPALYSPGAGAESGWLRAEISIDLPRDAVIEAEAVATDDKNVAARAIAIAEDASLGAAERQHAIWELFDHRTSRVFHLKAGPAKGQPVAMPLFDVEERWLWLRLRFVTPPGVAPAAIRELRVLYPDASIMRYVPAVFRGRENDPTGFLRSLAGVLETTTQEIDEKIDGIPAQIDPATASGPSLDYVARWLDLPWEDGLPEPVKRRIAQAAGTLLERRGTRKGLEALVRALSGPAAAVRIVDLTVDHPPTRLGGGDCGGTRLPLLLAGPSLSAPILGRRTILGRACLGVPGDPLRTIVPTIRIEIDVTRAVHREIAPLLGRVLRQYVPAGLKVVVAWKVVSALYAALDADDGDVLDGSGPGRLGEDSEIGRVVLGGRSGGTVDGAGLDVGFPLS